jgi:RNA polymerase sigma-70 factor (ECF subfamily)
VQEVLIAIHTRRDAYDRSQLFTPWVYAIARYKFVDYLRRTNASIRDAPIEDADEITASDDFEGVESAIDLDALLAGLSAKTRQVIRFVKLDGLSAEEAAARTGMSESAVRVSVHRGLKALTLLIKKQSHS